MPKKYGTILSYPFMNSFVSSATEQVIITLSLKMSTWGSVPHQPVKRRCSGVYFALNFFKWKFLVNILSSSGSITGTTSVFKNSVLNAFVSAIG